MFERASVSHPQYTPDCSRSSSRGVPKKPVASEDTNRRARPRDVFQASLGRSAAQLYGVLCDAVDCTGPYTGLTWPKVATLAKRMKVAVRTVQYALQELVDTGWIGTPYGDHGGRARAVVYHLHPDGKPCLFCTAASRTLNQRGRASHPSQKGANIAAFGVTEKEAMVAPFDGQKGASIAEKGAIFDSAYKEKIPLLSPLQTSATTAPPSAQNQEQLPEEFGRLMDGEFQLDQGALRRLWKDARSIVPDATAEEIRYFFGLRAQQVYGNCRINNPTGLMLSTIADWFVERRVLERREKTLRETQENAAIQRQIAELRKLEPGWRSMPDLPARQPADMNCFLEFSDRIREVAARKALQ